MTSKKALKTMLTDFGLGEKTTAEFIKCYDIVEKELEVLEIIKKKRVDVGFLAIAYDRNEYNEYNFHLTEDEYNKINAWLNEEEAK